MDHVMSPLRWTDGTLELLDQRALPTEERWIAYREPLAVADAIKTMVVRGAPAIGCAAAYGIALAARAGFPLDETYRALAATRPTAVNLFWALERMRRVEPQSPAALEREALAIHDEDIAMCRRIGRLGAALLPDGNVLTHCNAGALATGGYGTALGVIRAAVEEGRKIAVLADETRPFLQGARLTAWELAQSGIPVTLITDNMAGHLMARGEVQAVVVGADRIARNGDTANKIGTYSVAVLAREHGIPFYVAAPRSTVDLAIADGSAIPIEERDAREVTHIAMQQIAPLDGVRVRNPAFDVTPARYITAIITDAGVARAPYERSLPALLLDEKRLAPRLPVTLRVAYGEPAELARDLITNISAGGLFIRTSKPLAIGTALEMSIELDGAPPIRQKGRVAWIRERAPRDDGMGIAFEPPVDVRLAELLPHQSA